MGRSQSRLENEYMNLVSAVIREQIAGINGGQVIDAGKEVQDRTALITANIRTPRTITPTEVQNIEQQLQQQVDGAIKLVVRSIITKDADATQYLYTSVVQSELLEGDDLDLYNRLFNGISWYSSQQIAGSSLEQLNVARENEAVQVYAVIQCPATLNPATVAMLQNHLQTYIDAGVELTVRSEVGGTATATEFTTSAD